MKRTLFGLMCAVLIVHPLMALDKVWLENHLRGSLSIDSKAPITIGDPVASEFGTLLKVPVTIGSLVQPIYLASDEKSYFWGNVFDLTVDPDKSRMEKIDMTNIHYKGSPKALVKLVEYTDLECPYCNQAHLALEAELYKTYTKDQVQWVLKSFPLSMHPWAEPGAVATECAGQQKKEAFWDMTHEFFLNASSITATNVKDKAMEYAQKLKLNKSKFQACIDTNATLQKVKADREEGIKVGVTSTPTIIVNGRSKKGFRDFASVKDLIDEKLKIAYSASSTPAKH